MKNILLISIVVIITSFSVKAQDYNTGIGFRGGFSNGITAKMFIDEEMALEGILNTRWSSFNITGLFELHKNAFDVDHLYWFYGAGAHIGFWDANETPWFDTNDTDTHIVIGVDGIFGIEYVIQEIPVSISLDWKPALNIIGDFGFWGEEIGLSVRYVF